MHGSFPLLAICGFLAGGEYLASLAPFACGCWPLLMSVAILAMFVGYGLDLPGWQGLAVLLVGASLYLHAASEVVVRNRERPWMHAKVTAGWQSEWTDGLACRIRRDLTRRISIGLDERDETIGLGRAILLGERDDLPRHIRQLFVESGTMHIFAISGLHVMAIANVLSVLVAFAFVPRRFGGILAIPILWGYVVVIGLPPSAVRAGLMATFSLAAPLFWRKPNGLRSWCLAFLVIHLVNPLMISNVGNALSFAVMLAIVGAGELSEGLGGWQKTLLVTVVAWAMGLPISAHVFGRVTPGSMLANLFLIGTAKFAVGAGAVGLAVGIVSETLAAHLNNLTALGIRAMICMADGVARLPYANIETGAWGYLTCCEWYVALALSVFLFRRARQHRGAI